MKLTIEQKRFFDAWGYKATINNRKGKIYLNLQTTDKYKRHDRWYNHACEVVTRQFPEARNTSASESDMTFRINPNEVLKPKIIKETVLLTKKEKELIIGLIKLELHELEKNIMKYELYKRRDVLTNKGYKSLQETHEEVEMQRKLLVDLGCTE